MALYDSTDLLARCKAMALRPTVDERMTDPEWYRLLTEAQLYWMGQIAAHCPEVLYGAPVKLGTADGGLTYALPSPAFMMGYAEIRSSRGGALLLPGPDWGNNTDYVDEGDRIRMPNGRARSFADGPYVRYVAVPAELDDTHVPVLKPAHMRAILVPHACYLYAMQGGLLDPSPFLAMEQRLWGGDPRIAGDVGYLGQLKSAKFGSGNAAVVGQVDVWYQNADFGVGR